MLALAGLSLATVLATAMPADTLRPELAPLAFLVGSCWVGTFPDGKQTDEHCWEPVYGGAFVRDRHVVRNGPPYEGESLYAWDPATRRVTYWYWASTGRVTTGTMTPEGNALVFPERYEEGGRTIEMETRFTPAGADAYRVLVRQREGSGWKELWTMELRRRPR